MSWIDQSGATLLAAGLSALAGSILGPVVLRRQRKGDEALQERRKWVKEKLVAVFGHGPQMATDSVDYVVSAFVPPHPFAPITADMHQIDQRLAESLDLQLIQPRRSSWAQQWLVKWAWILQEESFAIRTLGGDDYGASGGADFQRLYEKNIKHIRSVESALTRSSIGTRPSFLFWLSLRFRVDRVGLRRRAEMSRARKILFQMPSF